MSIKVTPQLETVITQVMDDYWNSYFEGNLDHWANYLVDDYRNIGGTEEEIWNSKTEILDYTKRIIGQMQGATDLRNKQMQIIPYDPYFMVHELLDIFIKVEEEWTFYQKFRLSSLIEKQAEGWKVLHQHGSYPDSKTSEGEAFAFDTLKSENIKLQKAVSDRTIELENKTHELKIEASLERVRTVSMSMSKPDDMLLVCRVISEQLELLNIKEIRNVQTAIIYENKGAYINYEFYSQHNKTFVTEVDYKNHDLQNVFANKMLQGAEEFFSQSLTGAELEDWYKYQKTTNQFVDPFLETASSLNYYWYSIGPVALGISTYSPLDAEEIILFKRFRNVFEIAYRRFIDIEKAMAQAREAQIEAGLERVRSRSLAMHNTSELQDVIDTVHKELLNLNIAIHGGSFIAINSEIVKTLRLWGSGGTADTSEEVNLPLYEKPFCTNLINGIKNGPGFFTEEFSQQEKKEFFTFLFTHEPWSKLEVKQKKEMLSAPGGYTRSCIVSRHTSIFIINDFGEKFSEADNDILKRFGKVFEQTYTRFLDLQKAEAQALRAEEDLIEIKAARKRAEDTLKELQITQSQLIQSEKMASLGELTAGIAHEIQNPLNFVNNFSEVSSELADELKDAVEKNDTQEAIAIADDIKQNLEKINHHGKRADAIVKGMLQHSRSSSGKKEPTDINLLADEYLRLSYHGLRAKDKSFNATLDTYFDCTIEQINVVPQDIGRVLLNLFTNAFYAVNQKSKSLNGSFQPTVSLSTTKKDDKICICIRDNGNGIPQHILDKIYQPFFTTKPTGEGTGLGLSLSYDIIKAHAGEINVETKEGEYTEFFISLPVHTI